MAAIDLQKVASSVYDTVLNMNNMAANLVGLDAIWCRLLPYENGEDVIVQEYTLHNYDCPRNIKIVSNNTAYNVGNFAIDLFGIKNAEALEISIDPTTWNATFGSDCVPQKGDFVLIPMMHRPYEVISSTAVHTIGERITSWKCMLGEWKHAASRKESEDFHFSIDEMTNSQDRLFGEAISKEVADAVVEVETSYNETTYVDPMKDFEMGSITVKRIYGKGRNIVCDAYYDFAHTTQSIKYDISAVYDPACKENHWIYSCWFKGSSNTLDISPITIDGIYLREKNYWWFEVSSKTKLEDGLEVVLYRGQQIRLNGVVEAKDCGSGWTIRVLTSDCLKANKKIPNFWTSGVWKIQKNEYINLFTGFNGDDEVMKIDINERNFKLIIGNVSKTVAFENTLLDCWHYIAFDFAPTSVRTVIYNVKTVNKKHLEEFVYDKTEAINIKSFSFDFAEISNIGKDYCITNIRLYENEYPLDETYKMDMYSEVTRNASKLILVDVPRPENNMSFRSALR